VVNQGSERQTGCQFTHTCDGSLNRSGGRHGAGAHGCTGGLAWHGIAPGRTGHAHHTIWIVPVWAKEMRKVGIMGHHVFYRPPASYPIIRPAPPSCKPPPNRPHRPAGQCRNGLRSPRRSRQAPSPRLRIRHPAIHARPTLAANEAGAVHVTNDHAAPAKSETAQASKPRSFSGRSAVGGSLPLAP
jgi:hypothetical protein